LSSSHYSSHRGSSLCPVIEEGVEDGATAASTNPKDTPVLPFEEEEEEEQGGAEVGAAALSFYELNESAFAPESLLKWAIESIAESGESGSSSGPKSGSK
jgi:hypothetical protein